MSKRTRDGAESETATDATSVHVTINGPSLNVNCDSTRGFYEHLDQLRLVHFREAKRTHADIGTDYMRREARGKRKPSEILKV